MKKLLSAEQVAQAVDRLYQAVLDRLPRPARGVRKPRIAVIGIRTRGQTLATRIVEQLREDRPDLQVEFGVLDITFYRDDLSRRRGAPMVRATEIDFDIDDTWLLLVDDVLQTGRSVRAAMDALHDFGRPKVIRLAVLIDRGGRELPISADFVGFRAEAADDQRIQVRLKEDDGQEGVYIARKSD